LTSRRIRPTRRGRNPATQHPVAGLIGPLLAVRSRRERRGLLGLALAFALAVVRTALVTVTVAAVIAIAAMVGVAAMVVPTRVRVAVPIVTLAMVLAVR
jgi:hypothetical protein